MCVYGHVYTCMHVNVCEHIFVDLALHGGGVRTQGLVVEQWIVYSLSPHFPLTTSFYLNIVPEKPRWKHCHLH